MAKLLVYGDSFAGPPTRYNSDAYSWVDILANTLKIPYDNSAVAGSSLQYTISLFIRDCLAKKISDDDIIIFTFTDPSRLHLSRQNELPKTASRYSIENHLDNKKDYWYQINKNYLKWYFLNKDAELDYINASSYIHLLYGYAKNNPKTKIVVLKSFPDKYYIPIIRDIPNFIFPDIDLKTASDMEFNNITYEDWQKPFGTDIRSNHFSNPNLKILANSIIEALAYGDSTKISYNNFLKEILDSTITTKSQYKKYVEIDYLFYSKNMMDKLK